MVTNPHIHVVLKGVEYQYFVLVFSHQTIAFNVIFIYGNDVPDLQFSSIGCCLRFVFV